MGKPHTHIHIHIHIHLYIYIHIHIHIHIYIHPVHRIYASMFFMIIAMIILSVDYETLSQPYLQPQKTNISAATHSSTHKAFR